MAITYITGIPRSGKSYYAMFLLYKMFVLEKPVQNSFLYKILSKVKDGFENLSSKTYDVAYTNINQLDYSKFENIKPYNHNKVLEDIFALYNMKMQEKPDDELIAYAKMQGLYNCLFVIDECHNYFDTDIASVVWWFTYHGHLHQDFIMITQNLSLVYSKYTKNAEFFYKAVPPSSRFFKNKFRYVQYNSAGMYQKDKIGDFHIPMIQDIFKMYVSGAENNAKSHVKKYLSYFFVLFVLLFVFFKYFISSFDVAKEDPKISNASATSPAPALEVLKDTSKPKPQTPTITKEKDDDKALKLFDIRCVDLLCSYDNVSFPKPLFSKIIKDTPPEFIWFFNNATYLQYFALLPKDTFEFLKSEKKNEKDSNANAPALLAINK
ncbi:MAG: zonular occludens toxin domain-containing protein [Sulfurospirillaceae bacterium]|nr:zonular occludens toxin domain-containing protein [Sulfurospirillaceae bacterium]